MGIVRVGAPGAGASWNRSGGLNSHRRRRQGIALNVTQGRIEAARKCFVGWSNFVESLHGSLRKRSHDYVFTSLWMSIHDCPEGIGSGQRDRRIRRVALHVDVQRRIRERRQNLLEGRDLEVTGAVAGRRGNVAGRNAAERMRVGFAEAVVALAGAVLVAEVVPAKLGQRQVPNLVVGVVRGVRGAGGEHVVGDHEDAVGRHVAVHLKGVGAAVGDRCLEGVERIARGLELTTLMGHVEETEVLPEISRRRGCRAIGIGGGSSTRGKNADQHSEDCCQ